MCVINVMFTKEYACTLHNVCLTSIVVWAMRREYVLSNKFIGGNITTRGWNLGRYGDISLTF